MKIKSKIPKVIDDSQQLDQKPIISFPYYDDILENIKRVLNKFEVRTAFRNGTKSNTFIKLGKDPLDNFYKKNIVYKFNC